MATTVVEPRAPDQQPLTGVNDINADPNAETSSILDVVRIAEFPFFSQINISCVGPTVVWVGAWQRLRRRSSGGVESVTRSNRDPLGLTRTKLATS